jgi:hypothetical protein
MQANPTEGGDDAGTETARSHLRTCACMHPRTRAHIRARIPKCTDAHANTQGYMHAQTNAHTYVHAHAHIHAMHVRTSAHTQMHTRMHAPTHAYNHKQAAHTHVCAHAHVSMHAHTFACTNPSLRANADAHARTTHIHA